MSEFPKMLYGPKGWDDLADARLVTDYDEEETARIAGYGELGRIWEAPAQEAAPRRTRKAKAEEQGA